MRKEEELARWVVRPTECPAGATVLAAAGAVAFFWVALEVTRGATRGVDTAAMRYFAAHRTARLLTLMQGISLAGSGWAVSAFALLSALALAFRPERGLVALRLLMGIGGGEILVNGLKLLFHRPRPSPLYAHMGYSFPSGHSFFAVTLYGLLASGLAAEGRARRRGVWPGAAALMFSIGFSRVYVGVHYPTDVLAGFAAAVPWVWVCLTVPCYHFPVPAPKEKP